MKRFTGPTLIAMAFIIASVCQAEDKHDSKNRCATSTPAKNNAELLDAVKQDVALIKNDPAAMLSSSDRSACLSLAADLADLGGSDKNATHLRDSAMKDQAPPTLLELLAKRQAQLDALQRQVAYLRQMTHTEQPILVEVRMVEASRSKLVEAGIKVSAYRIKPKSASENQEVQTDGLSSTALVPDNQQTPDYFKILDELRTKGLVKELASPSLITVSGRPAFFNSGGEVPYLQSRAGGEPNVEFRKFGVQVDLVPMSTGSGKIRLELKTRLSLLDVSKSVKSHGVTIPGLDVREWDTGLELKSGETVIVGELSRPDTSHQSSANEEPSPASDARRANNMVTLLLVRATLMEPSDAGPAPKPGSTGYSSARRADVTK